MFEIFKSKSAVKFMEWRRVAMAFSALMVVASSAVIGINKLNLGLDFTGGTVI